MQETAPDFSLILEILSKHEVEFIVVGGVCAVLLGAPVTTFDIDIVHSRSIENLERLHEALVKLDAVYREHLPNRLRPTVKNLATDGHHLLITNYGPLDVLGAVGHDSDFDTLRSHVETISLGDNHAIHVLELDALIELKQETARKKDLPMLEILKAMRESEG